MSEPLPQVVERKTLATQPIGVHDLLQQAVASNLPVESLEKLLAMAERMKAEQAREAFNTAMAAFQAECPVVEKQKPVNDKSGKHRYNFAPLEVIVKTVRDLLQKHGFSYTFDARVEEKGVVAVCKATHSAGHFQTSEFRVAIDPDAYMSAAQKCGSALTFAKRYAFCNAFGIVTGDEDDDARLPNPAPAADANAPKVQPRDQRPPNVRELLSALKADWLKAHEGKEFVDFCAWAKGVLKSDKAMDAVQHWTVDAVNACREAM